MFTKVSYKLEVARQVKSFCLTHQHGHTHVLGSFHQRLQRRRLGTQLLHQQFHLPLLPLVGGDPRAGGRLPRYELHEFQHVQRIIISYLSGEK